MECANEECGKELEPEIPMIRGNWKGPFKGRACSMLCAREAQAQQRPESLSDEALERLDKMRSISKD